MRSKNPLRIGVLFGGRSSEHEVSLHSARNVMQALEEAGHTVIPLGISRNGRWLTANDPLGQLADIGAAEQPPADSGRWALIPSAGCDSGLARVDLIFPVLHGPYGEDGTVQGLLEMANIPYVGSGVLASAVGMDKVVCKQLLCRAGLLQTAHEVVLRPHWQADPQRVLDRVQRGLRAPLFVKPANMGSSIGISKVRSRQELAAALTLAARYDRKIVVEEAVANPREIEVSVLGNDDPVASVPGEIVPGNEFYDYAAKYLDDNSQLVIPAPLDEATTAQVQEMAVRAFLAIDGAGLARVDFLLDGQSQALYVNEINTLPGFTRISMYPKLWAATGISYPELVDRLVQLALERYQDRQLNSVTR